MTDRSGTDTQVECSCCGGTYPEADVVRFTAHPEVAVCAGCVDGLVARRSGLVRATPVLATDDLAASAAFWRTAGFDVSVFADDFAAASRDGVELHLVGGPPPPTGRARGEVYLHVRGVDELHGEWRAAGLPVSDVRDEPWDMREFHLVDPGRNRLRVGQNL